MSQSPGPYPTPPWAGQPYPGQPYPGQPYPGQPYGGWAPYPPPAPARRNRRVVGWTVAGSLLAVALLVVIGVGAFRIGSTGLPAAAAGPSTAPPADWRAIGEDEGLDAYAERCFDGDLTACDELYALSEPRSEYEYYGLTCGGRVAPRDVWACEQLD